MIKSGNQLNVMSKGEKMNDKTIGGSLEGKLITQFLLHILGIINSASLVVTSY